MSNLKSIQNFFRRQPPGRIIAAGFALVILLGAGLLLLPCSVKPGQTFTPLDSLFTATSAVCVTGLVVVDAADTLTLFGQVVLALLIQIGGLGITSVGIALALAAGRSISIRGRSLVREALNVDSFSGMVKLIHAVFTVTLVCEGVGAAVSYTSFVRDFAPAKAAWISIFHAIASFNNAGFDILGGGRGLVPYQSDVVLNLVTDAMVIVGGIGFLVLVDIQHCRFCFRKFSLHTKVVLSTTAALLLGGTVLLRLTEGLPWLGCLFTSMTTRTAGFATYPLGEFSKAGLMVAMLLMFIGASPGSTGGGIKTTTFFVLMQEVSSVFSKRRPGAFHRRLPKDALSRAATITLLGIIVALVGTFLLCLLEPQTDFIALLFEEISAYSTAGLSMGITGGLCAASRWVLIFTMYIGRVGAFTLLSLWVNRPAPVAHYTEEAITIG